MQNTRQVDTQAGDLAQHFFIAPKYQQSGSGRKERYVRIASRLRRLTTLVNRVIITNGQRQFAYFAALDLNSEWGKALANFAFVKHVGYSFLRNSLKARDYCIL